MENSQTLATESFSYSWLTDRKPCRPERINSSGNEEQNFKFDVPVSSLPVSLIHADEIFSDGHMMPVYIDDRTQVDALKTLTSVPSSPISSHFSTFSDTKNDQPRKRRKSYRTILQKCFRLVQKTIWFSRKSIRVDDLERKVFEVSNNSLEASPRQSSAYSVVDWSDFKKTGDKVEFYYGLKKVKSWSSSTQLVASSPRVMSPSHSINSWCDADSPIHEAILYCKRSIEK